jgi:hypothetical protein
MAIFIPDSLIFNEWEFNLWFSFDFKRFAKICVIFFHNKELDRLAEGIELIITKFITFLI